MKEAILAVDIGTGSCRAVLFDFKRNEIVTSRSGYSIQEPRPGWMEQDALAILRAFRNSIRRVSSDPRAKKYHVRCVILGSALHSLLPVDRRGRPLAPLQIWGDNRARVEDYKGDFNLRSLYRRTGCPFHPSYPLCKILWMRDHRADLFKRAAKFVSIKSFILSALFGKFVEDISVASATGLLNIRSMRWDSEALALTGLGEERLPELLSPYDPVGSLGSEPAKELNLPVGTPVIVGAGDGQLANVGGGSFSRGEINVTVGTSVALRVATKKPIFDSKRRLWCYRLDEDDFIFGGASNNGGNLLQWAIDQFGYGDSVSQELKRMDKEIMKRLNSFTGPIFYPFVRGERSPYWETRLRGGLLGFTGSHDRFDSMKATMEGMAFNIFTILAAVRERVGTSSNIICGGGGLRLRSLAQILADVLDSRIRIPEDLETSARGAYVLGLKAVGAIKTLKEAEKTPSSYQVFTPNRERVRHYKKLYGLYERHLPLIRSLSLEIDRLNSI